MSTSVNHFPEELSKKINFHTTIIHKIYIGLLCRLDCLRTEVRSGTECNIVLKHSLFSNILSKCIYILFTIGGS